MAQAANLAAKMRDILKPTDVHFFSDSTITIARINKGSSSIDVQTTEKNLKKERKLLFAIEADRATLTAMGITSHVFHVSSQHNPADYLTRPSKLKQCDPEETLQSISYAMTSSRSDPCKFVATVRYPLDEDRPFISIQDIAAQQALDFSSLVTEGKDTSFLTQMDNGLYYIKDRSGNQKI
jgi:hypothetical protein